MKIAVGILSFFLILYIPYIVYADGIETMIEDMGEIETENGFSVSDAARKALTGKIDLSFSSLGKQVFSLLFGETKAQMRVILQLAAVGILSGVIGGLSGDKQNGTAFACSVAAAVLCVSGFLHIVTLTEEAIDGLLLLAQAAIPTVAAASAAAGQGTQAVGCGTVFLAMQTFIFICKSVFLPLISVIFSLGIADGVGNNGYLTGIIGFLKKTIKWGCGMLLTLYGGVLALQTMAAGVADSLAAKTMKYAVSSFVPVIGGALSDSFSYVVQSARAIKGALGVGGILGILAVCLLPLLKLCAMAASYQISESFCAVSADKAVFGIVSTAKSSVTQLVTVLLSVSVMFIISFAMLCRLGGAY